MLLENCLVELGKCLVLLGNLHRVARELLG